MEAQTATRTRRRRRTRQEIDAESTPQPMLGDPSLRAAPPTMPPIERDDMRGDMRADPRGETAREEAERVGREILERTKDLDTDFHDDFQLPRGIEPDGWEYQWKRRLASGAEDPGYEVSLQMAGWRAVPANRHPELMPRQGNYETIERKGLILMECPRIVTEDQRIREKRKAMERMEINRRRLGEPAGHPSFARNGNAVGRDPVVNKSYEPMALPEQAAKA